MRSHSQGMASSSSVSGPVMLQHFRRFQVRAFMLRLSATPSSGRRLIPLILTLSVLNPWCEADTPAPVPAAYQDLYTELDNYLNSFNATLGTPSKYPVLYTGNLESADG